MLLAFAPWIAVWVIGGGHSLFRLQLAIGIAAVLVVVLAAARLHRGAILWAGAIFFAVAAVAVIGFKNMWFIRHFGILAHGTLLVLTAGSLAIGHPFTEDYARQNYPPEVWTQPAFRRRCQVVAGIWSVAFALNLLFSLALLYGLTVGEWTQRGIELGLMAGAIVAASRYLEYAKRAEASATASDHE